MAKAVNRTCAAGSIHGQPIRAMKNLILLTALLSGSVLVAAEKSAPAKDDQSKSTNQTQSQDAKNTAEPAKDKADASTTYPNKEIYYSDNTHTQLTKPEPGGRGGAAAGKAAAKTPNSHGIDRSPTALIGGGNGQS